MQLRLINCSPSVEVLANLSQEIGGFWKLLGRTLKVPDSKIEAIDVDNVQYLGVTEKSFQMLMAWLNRGESATFDELSKALRALGKERLWKKYCGGL